MGSVRALYGRTPEVEVTLSDHDRTMRFASHTGWTYAILMAHPLNVCDPEWTVTVESDGQWRDSYIRVGITRDSPETVAKMRADRSDRNSTHTDSKHSLVKPNSWGIAASHPGMIIYSPLNDVYSTVAAKREYDGDLVVWKRSFGTRRSTITVRCDVDAATLQFWTNPGGVMTQADGSPVMTCGDGGLLCELKMSEFGNCYPFISTGADSAGFSVESQPA